MADKHSLPSIRCIYAPNRWTYLWSWSDRSASQFWSRNFRFSLPVSFAHPHRGWRTSSSAGFHQVPHVSENPLGHSGCMSDSILVIDSTDTQAAHIVVVVPQHLLIASLSLLKAVWTSQTGDIAFPLWICSVMFLRLLAVSATNQCFSNFTNFFMCPTSIMLLQAIQNIFKYHLTL